MEGWNGGGGGGGGELVGEEGGGGGGRGGGLDSRSLLQTNKQTNKKRKENSGMGILNYKGLTRRPFLVSSTPIMGTHAWLITRTGTNDHSKVIKMKVINGTYLTREKLWL